MSTADDNSLSWINYPDELSISIQNLNLEKDASNLIYIRLRNQTLKLGIDESVGFKMDYHKMLFDTLKVHCFSLTLDICLWEARTQGWKVENSVK